MIKNCRVVARILAWSGIAIIFVLSVIPAVDRPVTGAGQRFEHFAAFAMVAGMFAIGYPVSLIRLLILAFFYCGGIELLQLPLPTRHARVSDFVVDLVAAWFAIGLVAASDKVIGAFPCSSRK
jgi:hypothetical protein